MRLDAEQRRAMLSHPAGWIACGFGSGLSPLVPGTVGSAAALLPWLLMRELPMIGYLGMLIAATLVGIWASTIVVQRLRIEDPGVIVWDEFVGQWITLTPLLIWPVSAWWVLVGFVVFRIFDIWKPWPASWADRNIKGGLGVMLDDVLAAVYAAGVLALSLRLLQSIPTSAS